MEQKQENGPKLLIETHKQPQNKNKKHGRKNEGKRW